MNQGNEVVTSPLAFSFRKERLDFPRQRTGDGHRWIRLMGLVIHDDLSFARITGLRYVIYQPPDDQMFVTVKNAPFTSSLWDDPAKGRRVNR